MQKNNSLINSLQNCVTACEHCASACLDEENVASMTDCIRLDMECADICNVAARLLSRDADVNIALIELCKDICGECAEECESHDHEHCQQCAKACRRCEEQCNKYLN